MSKELSEEERKIINELTLKLTKNTPIQEVDDWIKTLPESMQIIIVEALDVMNKNLDKILKSPNKSQLIQQILENKEIK